MNNSVVCRRWTRFARARPIWAQRLRAARHIRERLAAGGECVARSAFAAAERERLSANLCSKMSGGCCVGCRGRHTWIIQTLTLSNGSLSVRSRNNRARWRISLFCLARPSRRESSRPQSVCGAWCFHRGGAQTAPKRDQSMP